MLCWWGPWKRFCVEGWSEAEAGVLFFFITGGQYWVQGTVTARVGCCLFAVSPCCSGTEARPIIMPHSRPLFSLCDFWMRCVLADISSSCSHHHFEFGDLETLKDWLGFLFVLMDSGLFLQLLVCSCFPHFTLIFSSLLLVLMTSGSALHRNKNLTKTV